VDSASQYAGQDGRSPKPRLVQQFLPPILVLIGLVLFLSTLDGGLLTLQHPKSLVLCLVLFAACYFVVRRQVSDGGLDWLCNPKTWRATLMVACFVSLMFFGFSACVLIQQGFRFYSDAGSVPPSARTVPYEIATSSWSLGGACVVASLLHLISLLLLYRRWMAIPAALFAVSVICVIAVAAVCHPP
jgi:hypothetical protein